MCKQLLVISVASEEVWWVHSSSVTVSERLSPNREQKMSAGEDMEERELPCADGM